MGCIEDDCVVDEIENGVLNFLIGNFEWLVGGSGETTHLVSEANENALTKVAEVKIDGSAEVAEGIVDV